MILIGLFNLLFSVIKILFSWLNLPGFPPAVESAIDTVFQMLQNAASLIWLIFDREVALACLVIALACSNFDKLYDFLMWILAKIPIGIRKN